MPRDSFSNTPSAFCQAAVKRAARVSVRAMFCVTLSVMSLCEPSLRLMVVALEPICGFLVWNTTVPAEAFMPNWVP